MKWLQDLETVGRRRRRRRRSCRRRCCSFKLILVYLLCYASTRSMPKASKEQQNILFRPEPEHKKHFFGCCKTAKYKFISLQLSAEKVYLIVSFFTALCCLSNLLQFISRERHEAIFACLRGLSQCLNIRGQ